MKKYNYDENFFENINSEEKAYFLGLMYADGCVTKTQSKICDNIQHKVNLGMLDEELLLMFRKSLGGNYPIKSRILKNNKIFYTTNITSKKMVEDLESLGCIPKKSLVLTFPNLSNELCSDFIRGYFDGDGSIFSSNQRVKRNNAIFTYTRPVIHICGTKEFLTTVIEKLDLPETCIKKEKRKTTNCWYIRFDSFTRVQKFYDYLYHNKKFFLKRKKDKFNEIFKQRGSETIMGTPTRGKYRKMV
jgi:hypothetical protein